MQVKAYALSPAITLVYFSLSSYFSVFGHTTLLEGVPRPGIELMPLAVKVQSLSHWTTREVPVIYF